jgi:phosphomethylpyrimidine synthase
MEYIAIRENQRIEQLDTKPKQCNANTKVILGSQYLKSKITPEFVCSEVCADASSPTTSTIQESELMIIGRNFLVKLMLTSGIVPLPQP